MLERRAQMPPGSAAEQQQKAQIPKDLEDLRLALAAAKETQGTGARPVLTQQGQGGALTKRARMPSRRRTAVRPRTPTETEAATPPARMVERTAPAWPSRRSSLGCAFRWTI